MPWSVSSYSTDPNSNNLINGIDIAEFSDAEGYNNALRQIMADIASWVATGLGTLGGLSAAYRDLQLVAKSAAFAFADDDRAKAILYTGAAAAATINPQSTTTITVGGVYVVRNIGSGNLTLTRGAGVSLKANGSPTSANSVLAVGGVATLIYWGSDDWTVTGSGLS
jgi:hypothetical protein